MVEDLEQIVTMSEGITVLSNIKARGQPLRSILNLVPHALLQVQFMVESTPYR